MTHFVRRAANILQPNNLAAARALIDIEELSAEEVATKAMKIASSMCVYTNESYRIEVLDTKEKEEE
jgi:ATP-dependent protease HslVU (ClpYQ) peptidase subunit